MMSFRLLVAVTVLFADLAIGMRRPAAGFHNRLVKAAPAVNDTVSPAPTKLELWFAEAPDVALSRVRLKPAEDTTRTLSTGEIVKGSDAKSIAVSVDTTLGPGAYLVAWRTASADGHIIKGQYQFRVR